MESRRNMMRELLLESLRELMIRNVFEKITIKQICDRAGVIRATFYNYYEDKYDCLNAIVYHDLAREALEDIGEPMYMDRITRLLETVEENRDFYRMAYNVTGQNSFDDMVSGNIALVFMKVFRRYRDPSVFPKYSDEMLADYYSQSFGFVIKQFALRRDPVLTPVQAAQMTETLMRNSFVSFLKK